MVEAAKKEGKVVVAGSPDPVMRNDMIPKFTARFGIAVEVCRRAVESDRLRVETDGLRHLQHRRLLAGPDTRRTSYTTIR